MALWEYSLIYGLIEGKGEQRDFLDRWGREGWELILIVPAGYRMYPLSPGGPENQQYGFYYFKRPRTPAGLVGRLWATLSNTLYWGHQPAPLPQIDMIPGTSRPVDPQVPVG